LCWKEKFDKAIKHHEQALVIQKKYFPVDHSYIVFTFDYIGNIFRDQNNYDQALDYYQQALEI
jgi:tetratricopeptide (TPR) repeat protein